MATKANRQKTTSGRNGATAANRYVISTVSGTKINPATQGTPGRAPVGCEVSILDRDQCYKQVWVRSTPMGSITAAAMMVLARKRCAALNREEREWERAVGVT